MESGQSKEAPSNASPSLVTKLSAFKRPIVPPLHLSVLNKRQVLFRVSPRQNDDVSFGGRRKFMEDTHRIAPCSSLEAQTRVSLEFMMVMEGGFVPFKGGSWRVLGILAVSRSIGDSYLKKWVIVEPDTRILELEEDMEFLVLASDGLWDVVSNQETVDTVLLAQRKTTREESDDENLTPASFASLKRMKINSAESSWAKAACKELVDLVVSRESVDDITVVIIDLDHYKC
ncbi:unnamed protein product [Thlaspi arvense]|uniref:PPM-type phosphatase domain-containing protein n=1 Tax=Thlaspi arvense TaxID=13288 RepID=A0AAU9SH99_THLAR|nr:unnamed protein product [Thlaspi arvense]